MSTPDWEDGFKAGHDAGQRARDEQIRVLREALERIAHHEIYGSEAVEAGVALAKADAIARAAVAGKGGEK